MLRRTLVPVLAAVSMAVGLPTLGIGVQEAGADPVMPKVLLVTEGTTASPLETPLKTRLEEMGFTVETEPDDQVNATTTAGVQLVVVPPTVQSTDFTGVDLRKVSVPILSMKAYEQDGLQMAGPDPDEGDHGTVETDEIQVTAPHHTLAAGLNGPQTITDTPLHIGWVRLPPALVQAQVIATDGEDRPVLFAWKQGEVMFPEIKPNGTVEALKAHGCRVGFPGQRNSATSFTSVGWQLFNAAVAWTQSAACSLKRPHPLNPPVRTCQTNQAPPDVLDNPATSADEGYSWPQWVDEVLYHNGVYYLGGRFSQVSNWDGSGTVARPGLAACNASTGQVLPWNPPLHIDGNPPTGQAEIVRSLAAHDGWLYVGGRFDVDNNANPLIEKKNFLRVRLAAPETNWEAEVDWNWGPALKGGVQAILIDGDALYLGGGIREVNGEDEEDGVRRLVKLSLTTGLRDANFAPYFHMEQAVMPGCTPTPENQYCTLDPTGEPYSTFASVHSLALDGNDLYVGGAFTHVNGIARAGVAVLPKATGAGAGPFAPDLRDVNRYDPVVQVHDIFLHAGYVYLCGDWWITENQGQLTDPGKFELKDQQYNAGKFHKSGTSVRVPVPDGAHSTRPWGPRTDGAIQACDIDPQSNLLYLGGHFDLTNSKHIGKLAAADLSTGALLETWDTDSTRVRGLDALEVIPGESVAIAGTFDRTGAVNQSSFAAFAVGKPGTPHGATLFPTTQAPLEGGPVPPLTKRGGGSPSEDHVCPPQAADPCDTSTGNFFETWTDIAVPGRGPALAFSRTYNSSPAPDAPADGPLGYGWTFNYGMSLTIAGDLSSVKVNEENGAAVTFTLNGSGYTAPARVLATLVHNGDGTWTFTRRNREIYIFNAAGRLTALKDLNGYTTTLAYSGGQLSTVTDPAGRTLTFGWTGGRITSVTDTATPPRSVTFSYSPAGDLTDVIDIGGGHWTFGYDANHRMTTKREPKYFGDTTTTPTPEVTNHFDAQGRVQWQRDAIGRTTTFDYTSIANATKVTDPKGNVRVDRFDQGLLVSRTLGQGTSAAATWDYRYDPATLARTAIRNPDGTVTTMVYDDAGNLLSSTDPLGRTTWSTYNAFGQPLTVTDAAGVTTTYSYDSAGNPLTVSTPLVGSNPPVTRSTTYTYGDATHPGDVTKTTDPDNKEWPQTWDSHGNLATEVDPLGNTTRYCHDTVGRQTRVVSPKGTATGVNCATANPTFTTLFDTDAFGRPLVVTDPLGHQTVTTYDPNGNRTTVTDANGHTTTWVYDPTNQLIEEIRPGDGSTEPTVLFADDFAGSNGSPWDAGKWATSSTTSGRTVDIQGNEGRIWVNGTTARATAEMTPVTDSEVLSTYRFSDRNATSFLRIALRASGATGADSMPDGYRVEIRSDSTTAKIQKMIGGTATTIDQFTYPADTDLHKLRFRVEGSDLKVKLWAASASEPAAWTWEGTDSSITAAGVLQIVHSHTTGTRAVYLDDLTITDPNSGGGSGGSPTEILADDFTGSNGSPWDAGKWATSSTTSGRTVDIQGNEGRIWVNGTTARATAEMTPVTDSEVLTTYRFSDRNATSFLRVALRASGATGADSMPDGYRVDIRSDNTTVKVQKMIGGTVTDLDSFTYPADTAAHKLRFRVDGSDLKVKLWAASASEPAAWTWEGSDSSITAAGVLQIVHSHTSGTRAVYLDDLAITDPNSGGGSGGPSAGTSRRYDYHPDGSLWHYYDGADEPTTYGYDPLGRRTSVTDPLNRTTIYGYDVAGRLVSKQDHGGNCNAVPKTACTTMSYDDAGQLTGIDYSDAATPDVTNITYDEAGRRAAMTDGTGTSTWAWDSLGRLTSSVNGAGQIVRYGYDLRGNITAITYPGQTEPVTRTFDNAGQLWKVKDWLEHETVFNYDANGFLTSQVYPNGTKATNTPDAAGRLMGISHAPTASPQSPFASFTYNRDNVGQVESVTSTGVPADNHTYGYTPMNQLQSDNSGAYVYDDADNLVGLPSGADLVHDVGNQLTSLTETAGTTTFGYDNRGNRTTVDPPTGPTATLTYDQANRLTGHSTADASYTYNGDGLRTSKIVGGNTTGFTWDVAQGLPLLLVEGTTSYVYGPGGLPLERITSGGQVTYYHQDQLGSTRALTNSSGTVVATYTYEPYGKLSGSTGTASNPFRFAGEYTDAETGYQYLRARYYDPTTASFLTKDPVEDLSRSAYGYVDGNPLNATDPSGLISTRYTPFIDGGGSWSDCENGVPPFGVIGMGLEALRNGALGLDRRASSIGRALRTSPNAATRSQAARLLPSAGRLSNNPAVEGLAKGAGRAVPWVAGGLEVADHIAQGDSLGRTIAETGGSVAGGAAGAAAGGLWLWVHRGRDGRRWYVPLWRIGRRWWSRRLLGREANWLHSIQLRRLVMTVLIDVVLATTFTGIAILGAFGAKHMWRNKTRLYDRTPHWFPYSDTTWRATRRSLVPAGLATIPASIAVWMILLTDANSRADLSTTTEVVILVPIAISAIFIALAVSTFLVAGPKIAIPPHLRSELGWIGDRKLHRQ